MQHVPERRVHARFGVRTQATFVFGKSFTPITAELIDVSRGGCRFGVRAPMRRGWRLALTFALPDGSVCGATGTVVRAGDSGDYGIEFATRNGAFDDFLQNVEGAPAPLRPGLLASLRDAELQLA